LKTDEFGPAPGAKTRDIQMNLRFRALSAGPINAKKF
jgi:hypothetical protein